MTSTKILRKEIVDKLVISFRTRFASFLGDDEAHFVVERLNDGTVGSREGNLFFALFISSSISL